MLFRSKEVLLKAPIGIINFLFNQKREHLALIEARYDMAVRLEADPALVSPDYSIEKFKTATRVVPRNAVISGNASLMGAAVDDADDPDIPEDFDEVDDEVVVATESKPAATEAAPRGEGEAGNGSKKKRRRRRKKKPGSGAQANGMAADGQTTEGDDDGDEDDADSADAVSEAAVEAPPATPAKRTRTRAPRGKSADSAARAATPVAEAPFVEAPVAEAPVAEAPVKATKPATKAKPAAKAKPAPKPAAEAVAEAVAKPDAKAPAKPRAPSRAKKPAGAVAAEPAAQTFPVDPALSEPTPSAKLLPDPMDTDLAAKVAEPVTAGEVEDASKPKRKGWWSLGR